MNQSMAEKKTLKIWKWESKGLQWAALVLFLPNDSTMEAAYKRLWHQKKKTVCV
jgi:hypothetical protein